jgi:hypothetical protein
MNESFKRRLEAIERQMRRKPGAGMFMILEVTGGLPGPVNYAYSAGHRWDRAEGEEMEAFVRRAAVAAIEAGQMSLKVGGLPQSDEYERYRKPNGEFDFDRWWTEVAGPHYSEVPPCEEIGHPRLPTPAMLDRDRDR